MALQWEGLTECNLCFYIQQEFRVHAKKRAQFRKLLQGDYEELLQENGDNKSSLDKKQKKVQVEQFEVEEEPKKKRRRKRSKKRSSKGDDSDEDAVGEKNEKAELEVVNKDEIVFTPQKESESKKQSKKIANFKSQEKLSGHAETESSKPPQTEETQSKKKSKRRKKPKSIQGVSASRLASYNLKI